MNFKSLLNNDGEELAHMITAFKILSDPTRCRILCLLAASKDGMCVYELADATNISHSAASHQLSKLESHTIVQSFREGQKICYRVCDNMFTKNLFKILAIFTK
ncbi:MAG: transcriptional regulator [Parcubacteria group bacterium]|nr:transcriptional regulator [Parcubacteria group bacterium]|tara:strand:+ start:4025 stop:4336 length:312 start_codon:yes stop_codon:yes gene_type:complete